MVAVVVEVEVVAVAVVAVLVLGREARFAYPPRFAVAIGGRAHTHNAAARVLRRTL